MIYPICNQYIPKEDRKEHLTSAQHAMNPNVVAWIIHLDNRITSLEEQ
jgi:hypothetical protein